jgi:hypothetical protein
MENEFSTAPVLLIPFNSKYENLKDALNVINASPVEVDSN